MSSFATELGDHFSLTVQFLGIVQSQSGVDVKRVNRVLGSTLGVVVGVQAFDFTGVDVKEVCSVDCGSLVIIVVHKRTQSVNERV